MGINQFRLFDPLVGTYVLEASGVKREHVLILMGGGNQIISEKFRFEVLFKCSGDSLFP
jgi:hypothetical protein